MFSVKAASFQEKESRLIQMCPQCQGECLGLGGDSIGCCVIFGKSFSPFLNFNLPHPYSEGFGWNRPQGCLKL